MVARVLYAEHVEKWCEAIAKQDYQFGPQAETAQNKGEKLLNFLAGKWFIVLLTIIKLPNI